MRAASIPDRPDSFRTVPERARQHNRHVSGLRTAGVSTPALSLRPADLDHVERLLADEGLPTDDVRSGPAAFFVATRDGDRVGVGGVETLYLLTTTAAGFFADRGYERVDRSVVPAPVRGTTQFSTLCPESATVMRKGL